MNIDKLSKKFQVRRLQKNDINAILRLYRSNPEYFRYCPPEPDEISVENDMDVLPPGKKSEDKYYLGYFQNDDLYAVIDLICDYPNPYCAFIGFFMMDAQYQNMKIGETIIKELIDGLWQQNYKKIQLAWIVKNSHAEHFWLKAGFVPICQKESIEGDRVVLAEYCKEKDSRQLS